VLSTYLGHACVRDTYWYLSACVNGHGSFPECGLSKFPDPAGLVSIGDQPAL
jgi:hypothetical protein